MTRAARWVRLALWVFAVSVVVGGCGFSLAGEGDVVITGTELEGGVGPRTGDRSDLFDVNPKDLTFDERAGTPVTFTVKLTQAPTASVTIPLRIAPTDRLAIEPASLVITPDNWEAPQTVTVRMPTTNTLVDPSTFTAVLDTVTSADANYSGANPVDVKIFFKDANDAIIVSPRQTPTGENYKVSEEGTETKLFVELGAKPAQNVTVTCRVGADVTNPAAPGDGKDELSLSEASAPPASDAGPAPSDAGATFGSEVVFVFPRGYEGKPMELRVRGLDDAAADGNRTVAVDCSATSDDPLFEGRVAPPVLIDNIDNDSANLLVSTTTLTNVSENGTTATFTARLATQPAADVTLIVETLDATEASIAGSTSRNFVFTTSNWQTAQTITITGVDDAVTDGDIGFSIRITPSSTDPNYNLSADAGVGLGTLVVAGTNLDNEVASIVTSTNSITTTEAAAGTQTINVKLGAQPTSNVRILVTSSNAAEGAVTTGATLDFTPANWDQNQPVIVTGQDDAFDDGNVGYSVTLAIDDANTPDAKYKAVANKVVSGTNTDNDAAGVTTSPSALSLTEGGAANPFMVVLNSRPVGTVVVKLSPPASALPPSLGVNTSAAVTLTFDTNNWNIAQPASFSIPQDCFSDSPSIPISVTIESSGTDAVYKGAGVPTTDVSITPTDDEPAPTISVSPLNLPALVKGGSTTQITVTLTTRPRTNVTLPIASSQTMNATVAGPDVAGSITFLASDTSCPPPAQIITVTSGPRTGNGDYTVLINADTSVSTDSDYRNANPSDPTGNTTN